VIDQIAGYRVLEQLGRGGMGVVYRAEQVVLGREVALKVIAPELASDSAFRERFKREYRTAASIDHPHVVTLYEAGEADGLLFIAMRLVRGQDLRQLVRRAGGLDPERAAALVAQVGMALDAAHAAGLVHRDVKPANVLVSQAGDQDHAYLSDFGLTKHVTSHGGLTRTGQWVGTVDYIAPELIDGRPADARSDVYSLGCVLYETLTGQVPFPRDADMAKLFAHVQAEPPAPSSARPDLPRAIDEVVLSALAKDPAERPQSAGDLGRQARAAVRGASQPSPQGNVAVGAAAPPAETLPPTTPPPRTPPPRTPLPATPPPPERRGPGLAIAIVLAAAILTLGGLAAALIGTGAIGGKGKKEAAATVPAKTTTVTGPATSGASSSAGGVALGPVVTPAYTAELPVGWKVDLDYHDMGAYFRTRRSHGGMTILIDTTPNVSGDPKTTAVSQVPSGDPSYHQLRWRYTTVNGARAFDWAFAKSGERREDLLFYSGGNGYGVLGTGPPAKYHAVLALTRQVADSIVTR
jgi:predicted Ser/Thr protein kinase